MARICPQILRGVLEPLFDPARAQLFAQTKQHGEMLGFFLLLLSGSSQAVLPLVLGAERKRGRRTWNGGEFMLHRELHWIRAWKTKQAVLGTPHSPCSWMLLFLTSDLSPYSVPACRKSLSAFPSHSQYVTSSSLTWPELDQLSLCLASPWREVYLASNGLYLITVVLQHVLCSLLHCCNSLFHQYISPKKKKRCWETEFKVVHD